LKTASAPPNRVPDPSARTQLSRTLNISQQVNRSVSALIGETATSLSWARILGILKERGKKKKEAGKSGLGLDHSERGMGIALQLVWFIFSFFAFAL